MYHKNIIQFAVYTKEMEDLQVIKERKWWTKTALKKKKKEAVTSDSEVSSTDRKDFYHDQKSKFPLWKVKLAYSYFPLILSWSLQA